MSVLKDARRNTYYFTVRYKDAFGKTKRYRSKDFKRQRDAKEAERLFLNELDKGKPNQMTYEYAFKHYLEYNVLRDKTCRRKIREHERHIYPFFKDMKLNDITRDQVNEFRKYCMDHFKSLNSARAIFTTFRTVINHSIKHLNNKNNPCLGVKPIPRQEVNKGTITKEELHANLHKFKNKDYRDITTLLFYTGTRLGECLAIKWKYVNLDEKEIFLAGNIESETNTYSEFLKTVNSRTYVVLPTYAVEMLKERYEEEKQKNKYFNEEYFVFGGIKNYWAENYRVAFNKVFTSPNITPHSLRHSYAKHLLDRGIQMYDLMELLRHDDIKTTINTYGKFDKVGKHKSMKYFD